MKKGTARAIPVFRSSIGLSTIPTKSLDSSTIDEIGQRTPARVAPGETRMGSLIATSCRCEPTTGILPALTSSVHAQ